MPTTVVETQAATTVHGDAVRVGIAAAQDRMQRHGLPARQAGATVAEAVSLISEEGGRTHPRAEELFVESIAIAEAMRESHGEPPLRSEDVRVIRNIFKWIFNDFWRDT